MDLTGKKDSIRIIGIKMKKQNRFLQNNENKNVNERKKSPERWEKKWK